MYVFGIDHAFYCKHMTVRGGLSGVRAFHSTMWRVEIEFSSLAGWQVPLPTEQSLGERQASLCPAAEETELLCGSGCEGASREH